jgi:hypothetical protein
MATIFDRIEQAKKAGYEVVFRLGGFWLMAPNGAWVRGPYDTKLQAWAKGGIPPYKAPPPEKTKAAPPRRRTRKKKATISESNK